jgi:hypothetical protein
LGPGFAGWDWSAVEVVARRGGGLGGAPRQQ